MKSNKILIIFIFIYLSHFIKIGNAALPTDQNQEALSILGQLGETTTPTTDPCVAINNKRYFLCRAKNDGSGEDYIYQFNCLSPTTPKTVTSTLGSFTQINIIILSLNCYFPNIYNEIYKLVNLTTLNINGNQISTIPSNTILPSSLKTLSYSTISVPVPESIFNSSLESLIFSISRDGFSLPSNIPLNNITTLTIPISPFYNQLPLNMNASFLSLTNLYLRILNDRGEAGYQDYDFPLIVSSTLIKISFIFIQKTVFSDVQFWEFPISIGSLGKLKELEIQNNGFILPSNQNHLDLSQFNEGLKVGFLVNRMFENSNSTFIKFPKDSSVSIYNSFFNLEYFNFTNVVSFTINSMVTEQKLPVSNEIDYENMKVFTIISSLFNSSVIPDEYCRFKPNVLVFYGNSLVKSVPSCFTCIGSNFDGSKNLVIGPTIYDNFNTTSPPTDCPSYSFSNYSGIAKTNKETKITIQGKDFGWSTKIISPNTTTSNDPTLSIQLSNYAVVLTVPKGEGFNKSLTASFGYNYRFTKVFYYSYEEPVIKEFKWISINKTSSKFILIGTGFSFVNSNTIKFNNNTEYTSDIAIESESDESLGQISFTINNERNSTSTTLQTISPLVSFSVISGGQLSNLFNSNILSINTNNQTLNTAGGTITFELMFGGKNNSIDLDHTSLSINSAQCIINSITSNSITFQYPKVKDSDNPKDLTITIGGIEYSTTVNYIHKDKDKTNIGIIIGPIIGGLALISLILVGIFLFKRKKKQSNYNKPSIPLHERSQAQLYVGGKIENVDKF